jgi:hypothetical protein
MNGATAAMRPEKLRLTLAGGSELVFCGHHANRYAEDLVKITVQFVADPDFEWRGADMMSNSN